MLPALMFLCLTLSIGQTVGVEFTGNHHLGSESLARIFGLGSVDLADSNETAEALGRVLAFYRDRGYLLASADVERVEYGDSLLLVVSIEEGEKYTVGKVILEGNESVSTETALSVLDSRPGQTFSATLFEKDMERLLELFEESGFAFVQIFPESIGYDTIHHRIDLTLRILEGRKVKFAGARFLGLRSTKPDYLARESGIREGDTYSASGLRNAQRRLSRLSFLNSVSKLRPVAAQDREMVWVEAEVVEGKANSIYGVLGLDPGEDGGLTGLVDLSLENLTGSGRSVRAEWRRMGSLTSWLRLAYREPFLFSYDVAVHGSFKHHIRDTSYTQTGFAVHFQTRSTGFLGVSWGGSVEQVLPGAYPLPRSRSVGVTAGVQIDTRGGSHIGEYGVFYDTRTEYALRSNSPAELVKDPEPTARTGKLLFDFHHYIPTPVGQLTYAGVHGREAYTSEETVPLYDYYFLGGANSVRGYREEEFSGFRVAWVNLEQRFRLARSSLGYPFVDLGYYEGASSEMILGFGLGLEVETGLGMLGLDYGLGERDGPLDGKIHIKLKGEF
jgi:outer membrane protein insertion porin family